MLDFRYSSQFKKGHSSSKTAGQRFGEATRGDFAPCQRSNIISTLFRSLFTWAVE